MIADKLKQRRFDIDAIEIINIVHQKATRRLPCAGTNDEKHSRDSGAKALERALQQLADFSDYFLATIDQFQAQSTSRPLRMTAKSPSNPSRKATNCRLSARKSAGI